MLLRSLAVAKPAPQYPSANFYQRATTGGYSGFEIRNGALWGWGRNFFSQLGDGTTAQRNTPVQIGSATNWVLVSCGGQHTMGITADGKLWGWGKNDLGQVGDGTNTNKTIPTQIGTATNWVTVATGGSHTVAISADGKLWAWGGNTEGEVGDGTTTHRNVPTQVGTATNWTDISAGGYHTIALSSDGKMWAWGYNTVYQLGDGTGITRTTPVQIGSARKWVSITAGIYHNHAIAADGKLWGWGGNYNSSLGDGTNTDRSTPTQIGAATNWVSVSDGGFHSLGLTADGKMWAWGNNASGQVGNGAYTNQITPLQIGTASTWTSISGGYYHSMATSSDGKLWSWGENSEGSLGDGTATDKSFPNKINNALRQWLQVSVGAGHIAALKDDGTIWTTGSNAQTTLGDGSSTDKAVPIQVGIGSNWISVVAAGLYTIALRADGTLWAWGYNAYGMLGNGNTTSQSLPVQVGSSNNWASIKAGYFHNAALTADGTIWCWGANYSGQVGDGTTNNFRINPTQTGTANTWRSIAATGEHTLALRDDGRLFAWGRNDQGMVGDGTNTDKLTPTIIGVADNWLAIGGGGLHSLAIRTDGKLFAWGYNFSGNLGDGTTTSRTTPTEIVSAGNWLRISGGVYYSTALHSSGQLYAWGDNYYGQLGDGTNTQRNTPTLITGITDVVSLPHSSSYNYASAHIKAGRTQLCFTGSNSYGMFADGTTANANTYGCANDYCPAYTLAAGGTAYTQPMGGIGIRADLQHTCAIVAAVAPTSAVLAGASLTGKVWIEPGVPTYTGTPYVARHYEITPAANAGTASGTVTLYFTQAEFTAYNGAPGHGPNLPVDAADAANNKANIRITKKTGTSNNGTGLPGTYSGSNSLITPSTVVWDADNNWWAVSFTTTGFSGFFLNTASAPLPLRLLNFSARKWDATSNKLDWTTAAEDPDTRFDVERSGSGQAFAFIGTVAGTGSGAYTFRDDEPLPGNNYYRLRITGAGGNISYSSVALVRSSISGSISVAPNPARSNVIITASDAATYGQQAAILDMQGREMHRFLLRDVQTVDVSAWPAGVYTLRMPAGDVLRIVKE